MKVVAIDFETANETRASACAVGMAWIEDGAVVREHRLIRPWDMRFSGWNIAVHGIRPEDVRDQPEFPEVWEELLGRIDGTLVLAHNAAFDMSVLRAALDLYDLAWPQLTYLCTVKVARRVWPGLDNHKLPTVADALGIELCHHDAGSDAEACARIAMAATALSGAASVGAMPAALGIRPGWMAQGRYQPCS